MKIRNIVMSLVLVSSVAQAKTWAEKVSDARQKVTGASAQVTTAITHLTSTVNDLKKDRTEHANVTQGLVINSTQNQHNIDAIATGIGKVTFIDIEAGSGEATLPGTADANTANTTNATNTTNTP